jgi:hypothetical protein
MDEYNGLDRITVAEAANRLRVKEQAIRKRISRGTLRHDKDEAGRVYVYVDTAAEDEVQGKSTRDDTYRDALVESLQDQNRFLREELARKDAILMNMTQTMRQLTAPAEESREDAPQSPPSPGLTPTPAPTGAEREMVTDMPMGPTPAEASEEAQEDTEPRRERSWWRQLLGLE